MRFVAYRKISHTFWRYLRASSSNLWLQLQAQNFQDKMPSVILTCCWNAFDKNNFKTPSTLKGV